MRYKAIIKENITINITRGALSLYSKVDKALESPSIKKSKDIYQSLLKNILIFD